MKINEALTKLEGITKQLEKDDLPLEEALRLFEQGIALAAKIKTDLDQAKLHINKVIESTEGVFVLEKFDLS
ncbi:exodeoxyribonuclease VII small subunit [Candidatus Bipolaricaulota bacterium]|nr:exodeoxyribonuclease VII small subunit [Candidatus Bipolaricaulota bacterium]MCK5060508.1 exodeoxyribonuclease VII small subunit [Candidatus Bipolaricaulota bacterium]